jgi:L-cysteine desulfidase
MKKMNNYEAPKAEVIELYMSKDLMQSHTGLTIPGSNVTGGPGAGSNPGSY